MYNTGTQYNIFHSYLLSVRTSTNFSRPLFGGGGVCVCARVCVVCICVFVCVCMCVLHKEVILHNNDNPCCTKNGTARIVIIVKMLLEGFDHPPVSTAAICTNIHRPIKLAQFIGCAQRVMPGEKKMMWLMYLIGRILNIRKIRTTLSRSSTFLQHRLRLIL